MKRGDIYWADLVPRSGSEQTGRRPVVIISHDAFNQTAGWRSVIVVPLSTSPRQTGRGPTVVPISKGKGGLTKDSVALCHQITTLDRGKLTEFIGELPSSLMTRIEEGTMIAVGIIPR
ncbi:type II toxin-antitoxin system PemK/MazF family toxin [Geobacter grbiciae]|uniref:type II toxin-antitoxin system PemK/MazF family toxin n=1 Tax=Geobacter grbiciae TaxID=155042 RepID=UPI001C0114FA|nr:type II toxin-antitoxin system PemK/MazF family toxin [Geobacter grbiciae]